MILLVLGVFTQLYYYEETNLNSEESFSQSISGSQTLNETESELELEQGSLSLDFTMTVGLVALIAGAIALGLIGIQVLGSGISDRAQKIIWNGIVFYGLWLIFSVMGYNSLASIPIFGVLLWFFLTFVYTLGIFNRMGE